MVLLLVIICGVLSIVYGVWAVALGAWRPTPATPGCRRSPRAIQEGARPTSRRQYTTIAIAGVVIFVIVALLLGLAGRHRLPDRRRALGRRRLHRHAGLGARQRPHRPGREPRSLAEGLALAFRAGAVTGMLVAGLALLGVAVYYAHPHRPRRLRADRAATVIDALVALGFGASLISIFARLGGGIFTKGADVGGDLVGKVEAGIPEDDPRNPATIADNVGDNVGDCAGMAADLFETYAVTVVATMVLAGDLLRRPGRSSRPSCSTRWRSAASASSPRSSAPSSCKLGAKQHDHGRALQGLHRHRRAVADPALPADRADLPRPMSAPLTTIDRRQLHRRTTCSSAASSAWS